MGSAVETLCGQAYGAHKYDMLGIYLQCSVILLGLTGIPLAVMYAFSEPLLLLMGQSPEIARAASIFVYGLIPQIFAYAVNFPIQKFLQAQSKVMVLAWISLAALAAHVAMLYLFVSRLGWGLAGAAAAPLLRAAATQPPRLPRQPSPSCDPSNRSFRRSHRPCPRSTGSRAVVRTRSSVQIAVAARSTSCRSPETISDA